MDQLQWFRWKIKTVQRLTIFPSEIVSNGNGNCVGGWSKQLWLLLCGYVPAIPTCAPQNDKQSGGGRAPFERKSSGWKWNHRGTKQSHPFTEKLNSCVCGYAITEENQKVCLKGLTICIDAMFKFFNGTVFKFFANGNWISIRKNNWWQDIEDLCGSFFERPGQKVCSHWWLLICIVLKKQTYPWRHRHNQIHLAQFLYLIIELLFCRKTLKHPSLFPVSSDIYPWASRTDRVKYWLLFYWFLFCFSFHLISLCFKNCYFFM